jgi:ribosomal protein S18 acetylase RimI-like enzyme
MKAETDRTIREYIPEQSQEDGELLLPAFLDIWNVPENLLFLSFTQKPFDEHTVRTWFSNHLSIGGHYYAVVEGNSVISGIAVVKMNPVEGYELIGIGVRAGFKRQGIGSRLLGHVLCVAIDSGYSAIEASVFADNADMLRLLLSLSFIPVGMEYNRRCDGTDILRLKRFLFSPGKQKGGTTWHSSGRQTAGAS